MADVNVPLDEHWNALVTAALLGTDRREPPMPISGPVADLVADTAHQDASARMLADVAACVAVRRAAFVAAPPADRLAPPRPDHRPMCSVEAVSTWRVVREVWPVLEDEWVLTVLQRGMRLPPDVAVALLKTHRGNPVRVARITVAAGPLIEWVADHLPSLLASNRSAIGTAPRGGTRSEMLEAALVLPTLPIPGDLEPLLDADAHTFSRALELKFSTERIGAPQRPVLVNLLARCRPEVLVAAAEVLEGLGGSSSGAVAVLLADLARTRDLMLVQLAGR